MTVYTLRFKNHASNDFSLGSSEQRLREGIW